MAAFKGGRKLSKVMQYRRATEYMQRLLDSTVYPLVGKQTTTDHSLADAGTKLLGPSFKGVFASDRLPDLPSFGTSYLVVNVDTHDRPGSHWMGIIKNGPRLYLYDTFGRPASEIIPSLVIYADKRGMQLFSKKSVPEQAPKQTDCGARVLAWLLLAKRCGIGDARLISE
jgi:hypothetical protein